MLKISVMNVEDTAFAIEMTDLEKWGNVAADFHRLIHFDPDGCFVARKNGRRVGMITSTSYDDFAFLGSLIVRQEERGHGIGEALMKHAINHLQSKRIRTIELDGVFEAVPFYRRLGFKDKYLSLRFRKPSGSSGERPQPCPIGMAHEIISFDKKMTGLKRDRMIKRFFDETSDTIFAIKGKSISAYAIVKPSAGTFCSIAPVVASKDRDAKILLESIVSGFGSVDLGIGVPAVNGQTVSFLTRNGFDYNQPSLRMYLGHRRDYEKHVYAIFSPEKG